MSTTLSDIKTRLAYRAGEDSVPNDSNENARRLSFINEGYRDVMRRHYWWFAESTGTFNSVANQASYGTADGLPTDVRQILELRFQDRLYSQISQTDGMEAYTLPYNNYSESYFLFNNKLYFVPPLSSSVTNGIAIKYYKNPTMLSDNADTILIPDMFSDVLVAYAYGRWQQVEGERGSASDGFEEYKEILKLMDQEQNKYLFSLKGTNTDITLQGSYT